ncbi:MAG: hypothetical protein PV340_01195 [Wolbachia sp.]|nr:hypothetical protein [Wolbachia sp.]MDD9336388.1 hypothetical protein [Wolbachia sp.]
MRSNLKRTEEAIEKIEENQQKIEQISQQKIRSIENDVRNPQVSSSQSANLVTQPYIGQQGIKETQKKAEAAEQGTKILEKKLKTLQLLFKYLQKMQRTQLKNQKVLLNLQKVFCMAFSNLDQILIEKVVMQ